MGDGKQTVTITIDGGPLTGKTTLAAVITSALRLAGIESTFDAFEADIVHHDLLCGFCDESVVLAALRNRIDVRIVELHRGLAAPPIKIVIPPRDA